MSGGNGPGGGNDNCGIAGLKKASFFLVVAAVALVSSVTRFAVAVATDPAAAYDNSNDEVPRRTRLVSETLYRIEGGGTQPHPYDDEEEGESGGLAGTFDVDGDLLANVFSHPVEPPSSEPEEYGGLSEPAVIQSQEFPSPPPPPPPKGIPPPPPPPPEEEENATTSGSGTLPDSWSSTIVQSLEKLSSGDTFTATGEYYGSSSSKGGGKSGKAGKKKGKEPKCPKGSKSLYGKATKKSTKSKKSSKSHYDDYCDEFPPGVVGPLTSRCEQIRSGTASTDGPYAQFTIDFILILSDTNGTLARLEDFLNEVAAPILAGCIFNRDRNRFLQSGAGVITNVKFEVEEDPAQNDRT